MRVSGLLLGLIIGLLPLTATAERGVILTPTPKNSDLCFRTALNYPGPLPPVLEMPLDYAEMYVSQEADYLDRYAAFMNVLVARALVSDEMQERLKHEMLTIARTKPMKWPDKDNPQHHFEFITLMPYVVGYAHHKNSFTADERAEVEGWISSRLKLIGNSLLDQKANNRVYHLGAIIAAYGYATSDPKLTRKAFNVYKTAIRYLRDDGSLREDSERGGSALFYTSSALSSLVTLADMLQSSGVDAYAYTHKGKSIHDAVGFLIAASNDPSLIYGYATQNDRQRNLAIPGYSPDNFDMTWKENDMFAWAHLYMARFPDHPNTAALLKMSKFLRGDRIGYVNSPAGHARCFLGR